MKVAEVAAVILLALGSERLLNLYLMGGGPSHHVVRFTFSTVSLAVGALLLAVAGYARLHTRR
jgi:hypothetical protein